MFSRFDEDAQKVLIMAKKEMLELKHPYVGSEHLLLAILHSKLKITDYLNSCGINYNNFKKEIINTIGIGNNTNNWFLFTPLLKRVIENAILDSKQSGSKVDSDRLFISLLEEGEGVANRILMGMNIDIDALYDNFSKKIMYRKNSNRKMLIDDIAVNLNKMVIADEIDPVIGRDKTIDRIIEVLLRRKKNNPLLIGNAGVGKTALVEELARRIENNQVPTELKGKQILSVSMASLVSGTKYRGEFEERINKMIGEVEKSNNIILFIDEIHTIVGAGGAEGAIDASNILKPYLARGKIKLIGATTNEEYSKYLEEDRALDRRFQKVYVSESTKKETEEILFSLREVYEEFHGIEIEDCIIKKIVELSNKYVNKGMEPDKSIDILDCACTKAVILDNENEKKIRKVSDDLNDVVSRKNKAIVNHDFKNASRLREEEVLLESKLNKLYLSNSVKSKRKKITLDILYDVIYDKTKIPVKKIRNLNKNKISKILNQKIIGQKKAISEILSVVFSNVQNSTVKSFLLVGKSGVGKTFLVKEYAGMLYSKDSFIKIDMSEYRDSSSISKILGSSPGYIGYNDKSNILEKIKNNPYSIVLLDEIEKAHPSVLKLFLQVFDDGYMTNSKGEKIYFNNTMVFMTSNLGCASSSVGFIDKKYNMVLNKIKRFLGVELVNRIDKIVLFDNFTAKDIERIVFNKLESFCKINDLKIDKSLYIKDIIDKCNYKEEGARGIDKVINELLTNKLKI